MERSARAQKDSPMTDAARWFVAIMIYRAPTGAGDRYVVDHRVVLIRAMDGQAAYERALFLGRAHAAKWNWDFAGLHDLQTLLKIDLDARGKLDDASMIEEIVDGIEAYRFRLPDDQAWSVMPKDQLTEFWGSTKSPFIRGLGDGA